MHNYLLKENARKLTLQQENVGWPFKRVAMFLRLNVKLTDEHNTCQMVGKREFQKGVHTSCKYIKDAYAKHNSKYQKKNTPSDKPRNGQRRQAFHYDYANEHCGEIYICTRSCIFISR